MKTTNLVSPVLIVLLCGASLLSAQPTPVGEDFQINSYTTSFQSFPSVAMDAAGQFVVVWTSYGSPGTDDDYFSILSRRFHSDGSAIGNDFQVNTTTTGAQQGSDVAMHASGAFMVVWESSELFFGGETVVMAQPYASDGTPLGGEIAVNSYTASFIGEPAVGVLRNGDFVVLWSSSESAGDDTSIDSVQAQLFASDGIFLGDQFQINTYTTDRQFDPAVSPRPDGGFVAVWESNASSGSDNDAPSIQGQIFDASGTPVGDQMQVNTYTTSSQRNPKVVTDGDGGFVVVWSSFGSSGTDTDNRSVLAQRFSSSGDPVGDEMQINTYTTSLQTLPEVAALEDGSFVVSWRSYGSVESDGETVQAAYFDSAGSPVGEQFLVSSYSTDGQDNPRIASDGDSRFLLTWSSQVSVDNDSDGTVQARRFRFFKVEGQAFLDADFDGIRDVGESPVENVVVNLYDTSDGSLLESTLTDSEGGYLFEDREGEYFVEFEAPSAYTFTFQDRGSDDSVDSDVDPSTGRTVDFLSSEFPSWDAGLTNGLGDRVWLDADGDGLQDGGESGVSGVGVRLFDKGGAEVASTVTDADGLYAFPDLNSDTYFIEFAAPEGFSFTVQDQGNDGDVDSDVDQSTGRTTLIFFDDGDLRLDIDCGLVQEQSLTQDGPEPFAVTEDFQINETTTNGQSGPAVAELVDDSFAVVWTSPSSSGGDNSGFSVQLQRFDSGGSALGAESQINTITTNDQRFAALAPLPDGGFVTVWESYGSAGDDSSQSSIQMRRFDAAGSAVGAEVQVNQATIDRQATPTIAARSDGHFLVAWANEDDASIRARAFDSAGSSVDDEITINTLTQDFQWRPDAAAHDDGSFAVIWSSVDFPDDFQENFVKGGGGTGGEDEHTIRGRLVGADGVALGAADFQISNRTDRYYQAWTIAAGNDEFLVAWSDAADLEIDGRRLDDTGTPLASQLVLTNQGAIDELSDDPHLTGLDDGGYLLSWRSDRNGGDGSGTGLYGLRLNAQGTSVGGQFQINSFTAGSQSESHVAAGNDGRLFATWRSTASPGDDSSSGSIIGRLLQLPGELGDLVFQDDDLDGLQDFSEPGIEGVMVSLLDASGALVDQMSTDSAGDYRFYLKEDFPGRLSFGATEGLSFVVQNAGDESLDSDVDPATGETSLFTASRGVIDRDLDAGLAAGIGDRIWLDDDGNGVQDSGESGVAAITVTLYDSGGAQVDQTSTDADGRYAFFAPTAGAYYLEIAAPTGFEFTVRDQGDDAFDSDVNAAGRTSTFLYLGGSIDTDLDAGLLPEAVASIGDRVWLDANLNGIQDGGESGFEGIVVELFDETGASRGTTNTAGDGSYQFTGIDAGTYYLGFSEPAGFCYTARNQGNDETADSDVDPESLTTALFSLAAGTHDPTRDAGLVPDASIGNRVWLDDGDGIQGGGEPGIENIAVNLYDASDTLLESTTTDSSGAYAFSPGPGEYYLEFLLPNDSAFAPRDQGADDDLDSDVFASSGTTSTFMLGPGEVDVSRDAGLEPAVIGNRVWLDENDDGIQQPGEPGLQGIAVRLLDAADALVASTTTDSSGLYQFLGVATGSYRIEVAPPTDGVFSPPNVGTDDLIDSDIDPQTGRSELFHYVAASAHQRWDAGLRVPPLFADGFEAGDFSAWSEVSP